MFKWIKFTFGSFFLNKEAKGGGTRSMWNVLFAMFMVIIILGLFASLAFKYTFPVDYDRSSTFKEFAYEVFASDNIDNRVNFKVEATGEKNYKKISAFLGLNPENECLINTFENDAQKEMYSKNGYNLIVDTRDSQYDYIKFSAKYSNNDDTNIVITEEQYQALDGTQKDNYKISDVETYLELVTYDEQSNEKYFDYLKTKFKDASDSTTNYSLYKEIIDYDDDKKTTEEYYKKMYALYVLTYYNLSSVPTIVTYYSQHYLTQDANTGAFDNTNFLVILDELVVMSFTTNKDLVIEAYGRYDSINEGFIMFDDATKNDTDTIKRNVNLVLLEVYNTTESTRILGILMTYFRLMPYVLGLLIILALLLWSFARIRNRMYAYKFFEAFKISSSFLIGTSFVDGIVLFILSFFIGINNAYMISLWLFIVIISIRALILIIFEEIAYKKDPNRDAVVSTPITVHNPDYDEDNLVDLSKVETGTKVIKNDKVKDDEDEKMELM